MTTHDNGHRGAAGRCRLGMGGGPPRRSGRDLPAPHPTGGDQVRQAARPGREATDFVVKGRDGRVRARSSYRDADPPDRRRRHSVPDLDREPFETAVPPRHAGAARRSPARPGDSTARFTRAQRANCFIGLLHVGEIEAESSDPRIDLMEIARALESVMRPGDTVVPGPDDSTLLVICNTISCAADGEMIADRLVSRAGVVCRIQSTFSGGERVNAVVLLTRAFRRWTTDQEQPVRDDLIMRRGGDDELTSRLVVGVVDHRQPLPRVVGPVLRKCGSLAVDVVDQPEATAGFPGSWSCTAARRPAWTVARAELQLTALCEN